MKARLGDVAIWLATALTLALLVCILVLGWMRFIDGWLYKPVLEMDGPVMQTDRCYYLPGEMVTARLKIKKKRDVVGHVKWNLVDNRLFHYNSRAVSLPAGEYDFMVDIERIPQHFPNRYDGEMWQFKGTVEYRINPIKTLVYPLETTEFRIVDKLPENGGAE